jgi:hypothetical protein
MNKYEWAEKEARVGSGVELGDCRVRPSYLRFLEMRDKGIIPRKSTWAQFQVDHAVEVAEWDASGIDGKSS